MDGVASGPQLPNTLDGLGIPGVVYIRMLRKPPPLTASQPGDPDHLARVTEATFLSDRKSAQQYSLYRISTLDELRWAATGLLGGRDSSRGEKRFTENITFLWMTEAELTSTGAPVEHTEGDTACHAANSIHYEWRGDESHAAQVCQSLVQSDLKMRIVDLRKKVLEGWLKTTKATGCRAVSTDGACSAHSSCSAPQPTSSGLRSSSS